MAQGYDDAAEAVEDAGFVDPSDVTEQEVQNRVKDFMSVEDPGAPGAQDLIEETTDRVMEQNVGFQSAEGRDYGGNLGQRKNIETWVDRWGNIMGNNTERDTTPKKIVDSSER
jgi:hypothetical protein